MEVSFSTNRPELDSGSTRIGAELNSHDDVNSESQQKIRPYEANSSFAKAISI